MLTKDIKVSIITVSYNSEEVIADAIRSVAKQDYPNIEHIIIDGASTDNTALIVSEHQSKVSKWISEPDDGLYEAMNKGVRIASGDIIGILNSDDFYYGVHVISRVVDCFESQGVDSVFADLIFVKPSDLNKPVRYYSSKSFSPKKIKYGWMPAHPTFFVKKDIYEKYGVFKTDYKIAADFEIVARFLGKYKVNYCYIPSVMVVMRTGGISTKNLKSNWILNREIIRACKENGVKTNMFNVMLKYPEKIIQAFQRPK